MTRADAAQQSLTVCGSVSGASARHAGGRARLTFGSLLGVFLPGLMTRHRVADGANVAAMIVMARVNLALLGLFETKVLTLAWSWLVIVGTAGTVRLAVLFSAAVTEPRGRRSS